MSYNYDDEEGDIFRDPLVDEDDLYYRAALLMREIEEWHQKNPEFRGEKDEIPHLMKLPQEEAESQIPTELVNLHRELESFLEIVAAHPEYRTLVINWMVEIDGYEGLSDERIIVKEDDFNPEFIDEAFGSIGGLYQAVSSYLKREGYLVGEQSAGSEGWTLGLMCNDVAANKLSEELHKRFNKAIKRGLLTVRKCFWGFRLKGLTAANYTEFLEGKDYYEEDDVEFEMDDDFAEFLENPKNIADNDEDEDESFLDFGEFGK